MKSLAGRRSPSPRRRQNSTLSCSPSPSSASARKGRRSRIFTSARIRIGLELCPEEVGPQLRLQYLTQPTGEFLHVAMKPQRTYRGEPTDFTLANGGTGLALLGGGARPDLVIPWNVKFVFVRPSSPEVASR